MSKRVFLKNNLTAVNRFLRKMKVVKKVRNSEHQNSGIVNIYRIDPGNVGDFYCAPHLYFKELGHNTIDILDYKNSLKSVTQNWSKSVIENALLIGGGGLLNRRAFKNQMRLFEYLQQKGKKTVIWGAGHNSNNVYDFGKKINYNVDLNSFGMTGVRDYNNSYEWVPCVSCMNTIFDKKFTETRELGIIYHRDRIKDRKLLNRLKHFPSTTNTTDLEKMVSFIGKSAIIITDSYHAMYWAFLLNKKVLVVPNSSKFYDFKYQPVFTTFDSFEDDIKKANIYSGVLEECREINLKFAEKVFNYLNL